MAEFTTFFRRLGVGEDANEDAVEAAWDDLVERSGFDYGRIPQEVKDAYRFLKLNENRLLYRDLLSACASEDPLAVPAGQIQAFRRVCQLTGLRLIDDPEREGVFHLRRPDQPNPWWTNLPPRMPPPPRPTSTDYLREFLRRVLLLQVFRNATLPKGVVLAATYVAVILGLGSGVRAVYRWGSIQIARANEPKVVRAAPTKAEREQPIRADHSAAVAGLDELTSVGGHVAYEFQRITGVEWSHAQDRTIERTRELDSALIRNPTVREAWDALLTSLAPLAEIADRRAIAAEIMNRIDYGAFVDADDVRLQQIASWSVTNAGRLRTQSTNLEHLRVMLAAERFEQHIATRERNEP